jgi:hypothetical protein
MSAISTLVDYVGRNKFGVVIIGVGASLLVTVAVMQGCSIGDYIKVALPSAVQSTTHSPPRVTLNEAPHVREVYVAEVSSSLAVLDNNIGRADALRNIFSDLLTTGITMGQDTAKNSGFPLGGVAALFIGSIGGLFLEKPGSKVRTTEAVFAARDSGYDQGRLETLHMVTAAAAKVTGT